DILTPTKRNYLFRALPSKSLIHSILHFSSAAELQLNQAWRVDFCGLASNASTILFVVSASVLMRGLPGGLIFYILPVSSSRFLHFSTVDGCKATLNSPIVICCCTFNASLTNDVSSTLFCFIPLLFELRFSTSN
ncbi:hypothetical protein L9F63_003143, partial [Diploptera punctata]